MPTERGSNERIVTIYARPHDAVPPHFATLARMGERTKYTPGTFSWADLSTTDQEAAKAFYGGLFGWKAEDLPVGDDGAYYSMQLVGDKTVAAISEQPQQQRDAGAPPVWNSYVTVESADAAVERAKELGGAAHTPAFDVMTAGRMAVLQDPQGAYFMAWEPRDNIGAGLVTRPARCAGTSSPRPISTARRRSTAGSSAGPSTRSRTCR